MRDELALELQRLEQQRCTGTLHSGAGAIHLVDGAVTAADCPHTTGLDRLLIEAGVATVEEWRRARAGDPGGLLARSRLETFALLAVFDAAYFLLAAPAPLEFRPGPPHWLAAACRISPGALLHECRRRGDPGAPPWPVSLVDQAPVVPIRRVRRRRVVLTGGQAEVLAAADARRSIAGIARDLGRTTYGCLLAVRELTAAGLVEPPVVVVLPDPVRAVLSEPVLPDPVLSVPTRPESQAPPLRRRVRQATSVAVPDRWEPPDRDVLVRLRAALEELA
ncbi:hypothetical protein ACIP5Y_03840 [Nocardia sp. NPDC088792]|uniref:hypothetical protein n=1 Tax=Nocardia sp. NPDC088792 TaxID=3364332 RepID=UPI00380B9E15